MFKFASSIGLALAVAETKRRVRHWARSGILGAVGALFLVIALCFLLVAAHLYLSGLLNPIASAAIIGGVLLVTALVFFFIASRPMKDRARVKRAGEPAGNIGDAFKEGMARIGEAAGSSESPLRNPLFQAAGLALIVGFLFGRRGRRRKD